MNVFSLRIRVGYYNQLYYNHFMQLGSPTQSSPQIEVTTHCLKTYPSQIYVQTQILHNVAILCSKEKLQQNVRTAQIKIKF